MAPRTFAAVLSAAVLMGAGVAPAGATATEAAAPEAETQAAAAQGPTTLPALQNSLTILAGLVTSVSPQSSAAGVGARGMDVDPIGWLLSAAGIAVSAATAAEEQQELDQISSQLTQVQSTLNDIQSEIENLSDQIAELQIATAKDNCSVQTQFATQALANVQTAGQDYNELVSQAANASSSAPAPAMAQLVDWADQWATPLQESINDIQDVVGGTASDTSSLQACASALAEGIETGAWEFEAEYYADLYLYVAYWYGAEVEALNLYVEAQHVLALNASGNAAQLQASDPSAACNPPIAVAATQTACNSAQDMVSTVIADVTDLIVQSGAAYAWGTEGQVVGAGPPGAKNPYAWLLDINDFQTSGCTLPLTSVNTCGGSVGTSQQFADQTWGSYSWGSYTNWQPAPTAAWLQTGALPPSVGLQVFEQLRSEGLGDATWGYGAGLSGLIIYTGETSSSQQAALNQNGYQNSITGQCMLDTSFWLLGDVLPLCDSAGGGLLSDLVANYDSKTKYWNWPEAVPWQPSVQAFYEFTLSYYKDKQPWNLGTGGQGGWLALPQWATSTYAWLDYGSGPAVFSQDATPQYRWPVLPLSKTMCTVPVTGTQTMSATTSTGVATMCGPDMAAWLQAQVPEPPPALSAPLSVTAVHGLRAAKLTWRPGSRLQAPNGYRIRGKRNNGHWKTLVRNTATEKASSLARRKPHKQSYRLPVARKGTWRFKVTALTDIGRSRPSRASRPEYVPTSRKAHRYYAFRDAAGVERIVKVFTDGRVYWKSWNNGGSGKLRAKRRLIVGHTSRSLQRWAGPWRQPILGTWKDMRWPGWRRLDGPSRSRDGMPLRHKNLPRY